MLGLTVPVLLMGYYNPFFIYGEQKLMNDCKEAGVSGFIIVDLPPEEAMKFRDSANQFNLSYIPLITPTTSESRIQKLVAIASSFIYVVSVSGVTGSRTNVSTELPQLLGRIRKYTNLPLAVGFGVSTREHFVEIGKLAEGVVIGSKIISVIKNSPPELRPKAVQEFAESITKGASVKLQVLPSVTESEKSELEQHHILPSRFGKFGGQCNPF
jgi:tryptophan synthase